MDLLELRAGHLKLDRCCETPNITLHTKTDYRNPRGYCYWIQCHNCDLGLRLFQYVPQFQSAKTIEEAKIKFNYLVFCRRVQPFLNLGITLPPQPQREPEPESLFTDIVF